MTTRKQLYALGMSYVCAILMSIAAVLISVTVSNDKAAETDRESNRKWCSLLVDIDNVYQQTPPTTETGRNFATSIHNLRTEFEC